MLVYLKPLSIFPELHSDTLFGAITYAISQLYPDKVEDMIAEFNNQPPFVLSSTFPFIFKEDKNNDFKDVEKIRFYPKIIFPKSKEDLDIKFNPNDFKEYKKVKYLEDKLFFDLVNGKITENEVLKDFKNYTKVKGLLMSEDYKLDISYGENIIPNNSINRISNETEGIFYTSGNEFRNIGLFFLIDFNNEEYIPIVKAAIKFLRDRGFGRDISTGKGQFDYVIDEDYSLDDELDENANYNSFITLSRFIPNENDLKLINESASYEISSKRGKSSSNEIRKQIRFFKEGSLFPAYSKYYGRIVQSGKVNPAVEYGFAYPLKCIGGE